jgi:hypothetical protein
VVAREEQHHGRGQDADDQQAPHENGSGIHSMPHRIIGESRWPGLTCPRLRASGYAPRLGAPGLRPRLTRPGLHPKANPPRARCPGPRAPGLTHPGLTRRRRGAAQYLQQACALNITPAQDDSDIPIGHTLPFLQ